MNRAKFIARLKSLNACAKAVGWAESTKGTPAQLWAKCKRADWLLWLARVAGVDKGLMVRAACACAETSLVYVREDAQLACVWAIDAARRWSVGEADEEECAAAADTAYDAAYTADTTYTAAGAAAATGAAAAAGAAAATGAAATTGAYTDTHARAFSLMAPLVRREIPWPVVAAALARVPEGMEEVGNGKG